MNKDYLSDAEKSAVISFVGNTLAFEAVKKVLLFSVYGNGTLKPDEPADALRNWAMHIHNGNESQTNDLIGQKVRAVAEGINSIEQGFQKLKEIKAPKEKKASANPAL